MHTTRTIKILSAALLTTLATSFVSALAQSIKLPKNSKLQEYVEDYLPTDYKEGEDPLSTPDMKPRSTELVKLGWKYFYEKDLSSALKRFFMAIRMDKTNPSAYFGVAFVCSVQNDLDDAIVFYREALKYEKHYAPIYANLAKALLMEDANAAEAPGLLNEAIKVDPKCGAAYVTYASYYGQHKRWKESGDMAQHATDCGEKIDSSLVDELKAHKINIVVKPLPSVERRLH